MEPLIIRKIAKLLGYRQVSLLLQNIFRSRFETDMYISQCSVVRETHNETFRKYKGINRGKDIVVIATGPSFNDYKPIENTINIGVNKAIFSNKVNLDYFFAIDYYVTKPYLKDLIKYTNVKKFYGIMPLRPYGYKRVDNSIQIIPEDIIMEQGAEKFYVYQKFPINPCRFNTDIDKTWLVDGGSSIFSAMQFALYTIPKRIYIVGCDCSSGHFDGKKTGDYSHMIKTWKELKKFADVFYPDTEIISVNPVGLKGIFTDLYQGEENCLEE